MAHKHLLDALNLTLEDFCNTPNALFYNKILIGGGDIRQILPVVRGGEPEILNAAVLRSSLWPRLQKLSLIPNMRVLMGLATPEQQQVGFVVFRLL